MIEPLERLSLSDYFGAAVTVAVFVVGGLVAWVTSWITGRRVAMRARLAAIDKAMSDMKDRMATHDELIAVAENNMKNIERNLVTLQESTNVQTALLHKILLRTKG